LSKTWRGRSAPRVALALVLLTVLIGCNDSHITDSVRVVNETGKVLHFEIDLVDGRSFDLVRTVPPGQTVSVMDGSQLSDGAGIMRNRCTVGELRAIDPSGRVVSRLPPPICAPSTVVVGGAAGSS
jgi:hypothetical protein